MYTCGTKFEIFQCLRKWHTFSGQAEHKSEDSSLFSAAKHCRMEVLLQECIGIADTAHKQCKKVNNAVNELETKQLVAMESLAKSAIDSNAQHNVEISCARKTTEKDIASTCDDILRHFHRMLDHECESVAGMREVVESHLNTIQNMQDDHGSQAAEIEKQAREAVHHKYMDYEPSGHTPVRCELEIPSKKSIESLRSMPMEDLAEEFRENNPFPHGSNIKDVKFSPSLIPRLPLTHIN